MLLVTLAIAWYFYDSARWFKADTQQVTQAAERLADYEDIARNSWQALHDVQSALRPAQTERSADAMEAADRVRAAFAHLRLLDETAPDSGPEPAVKLEELESVTEVLLDAVVVIHSSLEVGQLELAREELVRLDTSGSVSRFQALIDTAIAERRQRLNQLGEEAVSLADYVLGLLPLIMLFLILGTGVLAWRFSRRLSESFGVLHEGARALAAGQLAHRVPALQEPEFEGLGSAFNAMAGELDEKGRQLRESNVRLEAKIEERTRALSESNDKLALVDEHRRKLLAEISHEFRTPLTVIKGESEIALRGKANDADQYRAALGRIIETADHATGLVEDLLFIVRADAGEPRLDLQNTEVPQLLTDVCEEFGGKAASKGLTIRYTGGVERASLQGDARRLRQVFSILLDNALRYSREGDVIEVGAEARDERLLVRVRDRGIGLNEEEASQAFQRFFRGRAAQAHAAQGTGLGLPVAKAIVEAHGGQIALEPREGGGAVATVALPLEGSLRVVA
ncbi:MAG: HAMP domain-containing sensor histidine kinase [Pseudomonadota bacterium]